MVTRNQFFFILLTFKALSLGNCQITSGNTDYIWLVILFSCIFFVLFVVFVVMIIVIIVLYIRTRKKNKDTLKKLGERSERKEIKRQQRLDRTLSIRRNQTQLVSRYPPQAPNQFLNANNLTAYSSTTEVQVQTEKREKTPLNLIKIMEAASIANSSQSKSSVVRVNTFLSPASPPEANANTNSVALSTSNIRKESSRKLAAPLLPDSPPPRTKRSFKRKLSKSRRMQVYQFFSKDYEQPSGYSNEIETQTNESFPRRDQYEVFAPPYYRSDQSSQHIPSNDNSQPNSSDRESSNAPVMARHSSRPIFLVKNKNFDNEDEFNDYKVRSQRARPKRITKKTKIGFYEFSPNKTRVAPVNARKIYRNVNYSILAFDDKIKEDDKKIVNPIWRY